MGDIDPENLRISDTEREQAVRMLGEHMSIGRLDVDEYGERSAKATAAKTRRELTELFDDLPEPKPTFGPAVAAAATAPPPYRPGVDGPPATQNAGDKAPARRNGWAGLVPLSAIVAVILFFTVVHVWWIFLLPAAVGVIGGAIWGDDWRDHQHHHRRDWERYSRHRQLRRGGHD